MLENWDSSSETTCVYQKGRSVETAPYRATRWINSMLKRRIVKNKIESDDFVVAVVILNMPYFENHS